MRSCSNPPRRSMATVRNTCRRLCVLVCAPLLFAAPARAQTVTGQIKAKADGAPVASAIVALLDSTGRAVITGLAEDDGTFRLAAPAPGRYSVRVERVGFRSSTSTPMVVARDAVVNVPMTIASDGVSLRAVRVNADRSCVVRPQEGLAAAQLWDEARKALSLTQLTQLAQAAGHSRRNPHQFMVRTRKATRDLEPRTLHVVHEEDVELDGETITPFETEDPAVLDRNGYIDGAMETPTTYYAPDAAILLSDRFLDSHCFRVQSATGEHRDELIGLAFEPSNLTRRGDRRAHYVDVSGVLWLDRSTAELRYMEYRYVDLPIPVPDEAAGGQLEFRPLPDGRWVVWRWYIRVPRLRKQAVADATPYTQTAPRIDLIGIRELGAEILEVTAPGSRQARTASLHGVVTDSIRGAALAGVRVFVSGTTLAAVTSDDGSYTIDAIPPGKYTVSVLASRLDSLLLDPPARELPLSAGQELRVDFAVPSLRTLSTKLCPDIPATDSASIVLGVVRDTSAATASGATVRAEWKEFSTPGADRLVSRPLVAETKTIAGGRFALCGLPPNTRVTLQARRDRNSAVGPALHFTPGEVRRLDLRLRAP